MPRYFFHIDEARCHIDTEGLDLPDLEAAKREALKIIGELMIDNAVGGMWSIGGWSMTVAGECAQELFVIRLSTSWRNEPGAS